MYDYRINKTGINIRTLREAFGETQLDLAAALGFDSPAAISMYENSCRGQNRVEVLKRIAWHFRITLDELLHEDYSSLQDTISTLGRKLSVRETPDAISIACIPIISLMQRSKYSEFLSVRVLHKYHTSLSALRR